MTSWKNEHAPSTEDVSIGTQFVLLTEVLSLPMYCCHAFFYYIGQFFRYYEQRILLSEENMVARADRRVPIDLLNIRGP